MPYEGERADKAAHFDLIDNPDVAEFLDGCEYLSEPTKDETDTVRKKYELPPSLDGVRLPQRVIAIDGSRHETSITDRLPSTRVGYAKVSTVLIGLDAYDALREGRFVNPFKVARLKEGHEALAFPLPSSNVTWQGRDSVKNSFRAAVDKQLDGKATRFRADDPSTSLRKTLFHVASHQREVEKRDPSIIFLPRCPNAGCSARGIEVRDSTEDQECPSCSAEVYPSDALRLWEEVGEYQSNLSPLTRFMNLVEHLMPVHLMRFLSGEGEFEALSETAFVLDGPLALFGTVAPLHRGILNYLHDLNSTLQDRGLAPILLTGLQKQGHLVEHSLLMERFIPKDRLLLVDDDYRYNHVVTRDPSDNGFGSETYYGQDFVYRTPSGRTFVFALPFPKGAKSGDGDHFRRIKRDRSRYMSGLPRALRLINHFESDLYRNSVVPVALAHRYTAISLRPGGQVLDLLTRKKLAQD